MEKVWAKKIVKKIKEYDEIVLYHHIIPDGDSLACSYGLLLALKKAFPNKKIKWVADSEFIKERYHFLDVSLEDVITEAPSGDYLSIVGDTAVLERIYGNEIFLKAKEKICFDHHPGEIDFSIFDKELTWQNYKYPASALQSFQIIQQLKIKLTEDIAKVVLYGILTDTNNFRYSLANDYPLEVGNILMKSINDSTMDRIYIESGKKTVESMRLNAWILNNFKIEDGVAYIKFTPEVQQKFNVVPDDLFMIHVLANIENVYAWSFVIENVERDLIKMSLRSNGFNVSKFAQSYNGGGHIRAASITHDRDWNAVNNCIEDLKSQVKKYAKDKTGRS